MFSEKQLDDMICSLGNTTRFLNSITFSGYESAARLKMAYESVALVSDMLSCEKKAVENDKKIPEEG